MVLGPSFVPAGSLNSVHGWVCVNEGVMIEGAAFLTWDLASRLGISPSDLTFSESD